MFCWLINQKRHIKKRSWHNRSILLTFAQNWVKPSPTCKRSLVPTQSTVKPLNKPFKFLIRFIFACFNAIRFSRSCVTYRHSLFFCTFSIVQQIYKKKITIFWKPALLPSSGKRHQICSSYSHSLGTNETLTSVDKTLRTLGRLLFSGACECFSGTQWMRIAWSKESSRFGSSCLKTEEQPASEK